MKLLFYINSLCHGGAERVMVNLAKALSDNHTCVLVTSYKVEWEYPVDPRVKRIILADKYQSSFIKRNFSLTSKLRKVIKEEKPDVSISFMAEPNFRNILACTGTGIPALVSVRNDPKREYPTRLFKLAAKILYPRAKCVVFQTEDAKSYFSKRVQKHARLIFNQVDEVFYNTPREAPCHDIITTGRLAEQKNHKMLIRAFASIADRTKENLIIYGEGDLRKELEALISELHMEDRIFLPGATKNVANTIKSAKLFVLTSDYEGLPNSLMEAMAIGLPCISTDCPCGGPRMLFEEEKNGLLVPVGATEELAEKMLSLLNDEGARDALAANAQARAQAFAPQSVLLDWEDCIAKLL